MIRRLKIKNLAVVESAEVVFAPGLNVITGETGAGKSVFTGALDLVLGARADASLVREGAKETEVEAEFTAGSLSAESFTVRRTVTKEGKSRAWIDDESVTVAELRERTAELVDIHGPRANQRLLEEDFQREILDAAASGSAEAGRIRDRYAGKFAHYSGLRSELQEFDSGPVSSDELDLLRFQVGELEEAGVGEEDETLAERHAAAAHAEEIVEAANVITEALGGDEGAGRAIEKARCGVLSAARHSPSGAGWKDRLEEIASSIEELSREVADAASKLEIDEEEFARLDARLGVVNRLRRKYGDPVAALAAKRNRLDALEHREERKAELEKLLAASLAEVKTSGSGLTRLRRKAGAGFAKTMERQLRELGFANARFEVSVEPAEPAAHGCDRVEFRFGPNPGEPVKPLAAIASSGEIARVMLAIKALPGSSGPAAGDRTLVFDEIDANIGGETAATVGRKLYETARGGQVLAITHLPQSAVWGERHLTVAKKVSGGRTRTEIFPVEGENRVSEIARMLGGENITKVVREHAKELLEISR